MLCRPRIFILCGEPSGDRYAGHLAAALHRLAPEARIYGVGGKFLFDQPVEPVAHIRSFSVSGFTSAVRHLPSLLKARNHLLHRIRDVQPDAVIMIDFPDFHLSLAKKIRHFYKTNPASAPCLIYYIPPQLWIWRKHRIRQIRQLFDAVIPAFEFETELYRKQPIPFFYAGHPIIDALRVQNQVKIQKKSSTEKHLLLLPGSRTNEIQSILPLMLKSVHLYTVRYPRTKITVKIGTIPEMPAKIYQNILHRFLKTHSCENMSIVLSENIYADLPFADVALSKPGTNNLELAFFGIPFLIVYRTQFLNWLIIRLTVKLSYASLINILSEKPVIREFLQSEADPEQIANELFCLLNNPEYRLYMQQSLIHFCQNTGLHGHSSIADQNARFILSFIQTKKPSHSATDS